jgi:hypothetical protein
MKLTKNSKQLMSLFGNNINHTKQTNKTDKLVIDLYDDILDAYDNLTQMKPKGVIKKITNVSQITRPKTFKSSDLPPEVVKHIDGFTASEITYSFVYLGRKNQVHFFNNADKVDLKVYDKYIDAIIMWLFVVSKYASKQCSTTLTLYVYMTSLDKMLPPSNSSVLNQGNVNTAFTFSCPVNAEIVIFRKEEWFKVFIHESFHSFGLDFSSMDISASTNYILDIFQVNSDVNLFESYTEVWAEIMNIMFCSFFSLKNKNDIEEFLYTFELMINRERAYSFFQLVKTLDFMGLEYRDLYSKTDKARVSREMFYKEDTNVLSYYVIKCILLNNYQGFLSWCDKNNDTMLQFKQTNDNQIEFCRFIEKNYKSSSMQDGVLKASNLFFNHIKGSRQKFLMTNMRMTIAELG